MRVFVISTILSVLSFFLLGYLIISELLATHP